MAEVLRMGAGSVPPATPAFDAAPALTLLRSVPCPG
jgi:hypothetical protein